MYRSGPRSWVIGQVDIFKSLAANGDPFVRREVRNGLRDPCPPGGRGPQGREPPRGAREAPREVQAAPVGLRAGSRGAPEGPRGDHCGPLGQEQAALFEEYGNEAEQIILDMKAESHARRSRANIRAKANPDRRRYSPAPANGPLEALMASMSLEGKTAAASVDRARDPRLSARRPDRPTAECFFKEK